MKLILVFQYSRPDLMVKKLRYYARYIVVCLLLRKTKQVRDLIKEFGRQIDDYVKTYDPSDQLEWQLVKNEINEFMDADAILNIENNGMENRSNAITLTNRLDTDQVPKIAPNSNLISNSDFIKNTSSHLNLQEILIVGNCQDQIKFSELSLDMFRMLQACEREPSVSSADINSSLLKNITNNIESNSTGSGLALNDLERSRETSQAIVQRDNSHKYLLYKPSFSQFVTYLSAAFKDMPPHGVLMVYVSADACESHNKNTTDRTTKNLIVTFLMFLARATYFVFLVVFSCV
jgi:hypothetical protein